MLELEVGKEVANLTCDCCGCAMQSVNGFIYKDDFAYSVYFALLETGHSEISVGFTVSTGKWWEDDAAAVAQRVWVFMRFWPSEKGTGFEIRVDEPQLSRHYETQQANLGKPLTCQDARDRSTLDDFFDIARFVIDNDPAVLSYLRGERVDSAGRDVNNA